VNLDTFIKLLILLALAPYWWPVLKALYADFQGALADEGGLFGSDPSPRQLAELREKYRDYESPLVNESYAEALARRRARPMREGPSAGGQNDAGRQASPGPRQRRF
jgi:hypothetical protein